MRRRAQLQELTEQLADEAAKRRKLQDALVASADKADALGVLHCRLCCATASCFHR